MPKFDVRIPFTGVLYIQVEAESEERAKEIAMDEPVHLQIRQNYVGGLQLEELETHDMITEGNVFYGLLNEVEVMEVKNV